MKESSNELYTSGRYLQNKPTWGVEDSEWKAEMIYKLYKKNGLSPKHITEAGCGAGAILEELSKKDSNLETLDGFDISPQAIAIAKQRENNKIKFYNEDYISLEYAHSNLLLVIDVLEHVDDYYNFLRKLHGKSDYFIFHIPLDLSCRTILKPHVLLQQRDSVGHIHYFSEEMVNWFLKDIGFEIIDWHYTKPFIDLNKPSAFKTGIKKILRNISFAINKPLSVKLWGSYSMLILAK